MLRRLPIQLFNKFNDQHLKTLILRKKIQYTHISFSPQIKEESVVRLYDVGRLRADEEDYEDMDDDDDNANEDDDAEGVLLGDDDDDDDDEEDVFEIGSGILS